MCEDITAEEAQNLLEVLLEICQDCCQDDSDLIKDI